MITYCLIFFNQFISISIEQFNSTCTLCLVLFQNSCCESKIIIAKKLLVQHCQANPTVSYSEIACHQIGLACKTPVLIIQGLVSSEPAAISQSAAAARNNLCGKMSVSVHVRNQFCTVQTQQRLSCNCGLVSSISQSKELGWIGC